jgi:HlyD family secretion protein
MKKLLLLMSLLWGGGAYGIWYWTDHRSRAVAYRTVAIKRGDLRSTINATGTLEPEEVVDVGAQVAGRIDSFGSDPHDRSKSVTYGTRVEQGTVLARLATALYQARVDQAKGHVAKAKADIEQAQAKLRQAQRELDRTTKLRSRGTGIVSEQECDAALANFESAKAALGVNQSELLIAQADLEEATVNLGYTTIQSPVKGIVLDRRINIGQTVVASLNAPSLFLIAKDLSRLEIWSSVNETDIGSIHEGQVVRFTVGALPRDSFEGKVSKIRLNASMAQNVVTYTVVISVDNSDGRLLPYLTVRLQFDVEARRDVLLVPNAALRWQPRVQNVAPLARESYAMAPRRRAPAKGEVAEAEPAIDHEAGGVLWIRQGDFVQPVTVSVGLSDGVVTEISGGGLTEADSVVVGASRVDSEPDALSILPHTWTDSKK